MPTSEFTPTLVEVGALMRARTKNDVGTEVGTFDDDTRPTGDQVTDLIDQAVNDVATRVGANMPNTYLQASAKSMAILRTAMLVELSFWPEQVRSDRSPYDSYKTLYDDGMKTLEEGVQDAGGTNGDGDPGSPVASGLPSYGFPEDAGGMVGWQSRW